MDFEIFNDKQIDDECKSINKCKSIQRVISGLVYYQQLTKSDRNNIGQAIFTQFLN